MELALRFSITNRLMSLLGRWQQGLPKAMGSNLGDGHLLSLAYYVDAIEVDRRTMEYLKQIKRFDPEFDGKEIPAFRNSTLETLVKRIDEALSIDD